MIEMKVTQKKISRPCYPSLDLLLDLIEAVSGVQNDLFLIRSNEDTAGSPSSPQHFENVYNRNMISSSGPNVVRIDGSYGEGGGQILRTSLALSCVLGRAVSITNIRTARKKPGLQPQHLTSIKAAAAVSGATVEGAELSSTGLLFRPAGILSGTFHFDVSEKKGSAGSSSLVLQTILLPLSFAEKESTVLVTGGTHVPWSPSFHYLSAVVAPLLSRLGVCAEFDIVSWGWYPVGGGRVKARIKPLIAINPLLLLDRGKLLRISGISAISNLPDHIAIRQRDRALAILSRHGIDGSIDILSAPSPGRGSFLFLRAEFENISAGFGSLGAIGKRAEQVADETCSELLAHVQAKSALDPHLADQIIPYLALSRGTSEFTTSRVTTHLLTNLWVVKQFLDVDVRVDGNEGEEGRVIVRPL
jgi:RNA 3'-terminal phosphate cyclase (ATP)